MTANTKIFFGYVRVSTLKQGMHGVSLQEQKSAIEAYAARNGYIVGAWFEEQETAAKRGRRVFKQMMRKLEARQADGVVMHKIDRGARNLHDWIGLGTLADRGIEVHFAHDSLDMGSRGGRLAADIQAVVAADFIRNLRDETRKGFYGRLKQGLYPLRAPTGYLDAGKGKDKQIDPVRGPLVRQAFELYATGEYSFKQLQPELFRRGLRGRNGTGISLNGLTTMLNNPFYMGLIHIRKTNEMFQGSHTPLITKALYDQVQSVLRGERTGGPQKNDFLFRRFIRCAGCGRSLIGERIRDRYTYYRCHTDGCPGACIAEDTIDSAIRAKLLPLRFESEDLRDVRDLVEKERAKITNERGEREAALRLFVGKCDERLARLTDALVDGLIDKETFDARNATILKDKRGYLDRLQRTASEPSLEDRAQEIVEQANVAYLNYDIGIVALKRETLHSTISNFLGSGKSPAITLKSPFQEYLNWLNLTYCDHRRDRPRTRAKKILAIFKKAAKQELHEVIVASATTSLKSRSPALDSAANEEYS